MKSKKKILLLIKTPPPITGATLMNQRVLNSHILRDNFHTRAICISYAKNISDLGFISIGKFLIFFKIFLRLFNELLFHRPHLVYFQISPTGFVFIRELFFVSVIKLFKIKIIYHLHGKGIQVEAQSKIKKILYKFAFNNTEVICVSNLLKNDIDGVFRGNIHIVNNGIPDVPPEFLELIKETQNSIPNILFLSNLLISKGIIDFLNALNILNKNNIEFNAKIVGAIGDFTESQLNNELNRSDLIRKVDYLGPLYGDAKYKILSEIDILVFPTKNDIWGNVILEAMQMSKPVIATQEGAIPEIIDDGITGFLVDKKSPQQIAEKLEYLIKEPVIRIAMGNAGREKYLKKYTIEKFEQNLKNVFVSILSQNYI